jgi:hypothetical protein
MVKDAICLRKMKYIILINNFAFININNYYVFIILKSILFIFYV